MNKNQSLGALRAFLTALGTMLATWGFSDGHNFTPIIGVILTGFSLSWGVFHHKDPSTPGKMSWSLFRKFINVLCSAAATYGFLHPDKVSAIAPFLAALGPILAARFSWIDNSDPQPEGQEDEPPPFDMPILLLLAALTIFLPSCGLNVQARTPYGDATLSPEGRLSIIPKAKALDLDLYSST